MVNAIDIYSLSSEELLTVVECYPWFAAARMELCKRLSEISALTNAQIASAALYVGERSILYKLATKQNDYSDKDAAKLLSSYIEEPIQQVKKVYTVGGDYFSQEDYNNVELSQQQGVFTKYALKAKENTQEEQSIPEYYTETLAKLYLQQECFTQAIDIYSHLSLLYPEKNAYFASLIDEIKQKEIII